MLVAQNLALLMKLDFAAVEFTWIFKNILGLDSMEPKISAWFGYLNSHVRTKRQGYVMCFPFQGLLFNIYIIILKFSLVIWFMKKRKLQLAIMKPIGDWSLHFYFQIALLFCDFCGSICLTWLPEPSCSVRHPCGVLCLVFWTFLWLSISQVTINYIG